jgi:hypothetical protein
VEDFSRRDFSGLSSRIEFGGIYLREIRLMIMTIDITYNYGYLA